MKLGPFIISSLDMDKNDKNFGPFITFFLKMFSSSLEISNLIFGQKRIKYSPLNSRNCSAVSLRANYSAWISKLIKSTFFPDGFYFSNRQVCDSPPPPPSRFWQVWVRLNKRLYWSKKLANK